MPTGSESSPEPSRRQPRRRSRAGRWILLVVLVLVVSTAAVSVWQVGRISAATLPAATIEKTKISVSTNDDKVDVDLPDYGAGAVTALGYDAKTGLQDPDAEPEPMVEFGSDRAMPIGSVAKVVTALMVVDARPLTGGEGRSITLTDRDVTYYQQTVAEGGSNAPVKAGVTISEREALALMLIPSANNYSKSLAVWAFGSYDKFLTTARSWLDKHDLDNTVLADSSGLSEKTVSTKSDLLKIGQLLTEDKGLSRIVATKKISVAGIGTVENTNQLLDKRGVDGIKTGTTRQAGACLLFSFDHKVGGKVVTMVGVMLGAPSHATLDSDLLRLIPSFTDEFSTVKLIKKGSTLATAASPWGQHADLRAGKSVTVRAWGPVSVHTALQAPTVSELRPGQQVGQYKTTVNGKTISVPLVSSAAISDPGLTWRLRNRHTLTY